MDLLEEIEKFNEGLELARSHKPRSVSAKTLYEKIADNIYYINPAFIEDFKSIASKNTFVFRGVFEDAYLCFNPFKSEEKQSQIIYDTICPNKPTMLPLSVLDKGVDFLFNYEATGANTWKNIETGATERVYRFDGNVMLVLDMETGNFHAEKANNIHDMFLENMERNPTDILPPHGNVFMSNMIIAYMQSDMGDEHFEYEEEAYLKRRIADHVKSQMTNSGTVKFEDVEKEFVEEYGTFTISKINFHDEDYYVFYNEEKEYRLPKEYDESLYLSRDDVVEEIQNNYISVHNDETLELNVASEYWLKKSPELESHKAKASKKPKKKSGRKL